MEKRIKLVGLVLSCLTLFAACGEKEKEIPVQSIAISQPSAELIIGETFNLKATVSPSNASYDGLTWTSTKPKVASVSESGLVIALSEGNTTITAMAGGKTASCSVTVVKGFVPVSSISLNKDSIELFEGDSETLTAIVSPNDATDMTITWASLNTSVATVKDGTITAIREGEATITAKAGEKIASCNVVVFKSPVPEAIDLGLSVKWASFNLDAFSPEEYGEYYAWGSIIPFYESLDPLIWLSGKEEGYMWSSCNYCRGSYDTLTKYCSDPSYGYNGFTDNKSVLEPNDDAAFCTLGDKWRMPTISEQRELLDKCSWEWTSLNGVNGYRITGANGNSIFLPAAGWWLGQSLCEVGTNGCYWSSTSYGTDMKYCLEFGRFGKDGLDCPEMMFITGCTIRPVYGDSPSIPVQSVSLDQSQIDLEVGQTTLLTATITPLDATNKSVTWTSSNTSIATVSSSGVVTAKATGQAIITVKTNDGGKKATCSVRVSAATVAVTGVRLNKTFLSMNAGDTQTLTATVTPSNATNKTVTWSSSNTSIATVSSSGVVTAKVTGQATITVKTDDGGFTATCSVTVSASPYTVAVPEAVDLGLSVKWASFNLGATEPEHEGDYFAWGETEPYYESGEARSENPHWRPGKEGGYDWSSYIWCRGSIRTLTKYCSYATYGYNEFCDYKRKLSLEDDAAHVLLGGKWRMPSEKEIDELRSQCDWHLFFVNDYYGHHMFYEVKSRVNGNYILLPLAGRRVDTRVVCVGTEGAYWSQDNNWSQPCYSMSLHLYEEGQTLKAVKSNYRCFGESIRPVCDY